MEAAMAGAASRKMPYFRGAFEVDKHKVANIIMDVKVQISIFIG
jgi:hypothetical protein